MVSASIVPAPKVRVRIRHVASGTYVTAQNESDGVSLPLTADSPSSATQWFHIVLTDDAKSSGKYGIFSISNDANVFSIIVFVRGVGMEFVSLFPASKGPPNNRQVNRWFNLPLSPDATEFQISDPLTGSPFCNTPSPSTISSQQLGIGAPGSTDSNTWFVFDYEDMKFDHIDLNLDGATMTPPNLLTLATHTVDNTVPDGPDQDPSITLSHEVTTETSYSLNEGASFAKSVEATVAVPDIVADKVVVSETKTQNITWGKRELKTHSVGLIVSVDTPAGQIITATLVAKKTTLNVPFNAVYKGKDSSATMALPGVYTGTPVYDIDVTYSKGHPVV